MGLLFGGVCRAISIKTLCQICGNLIDSSWHLVTQHATSVTVNIIKTMVNKWIN